MSKLSLKMKLGLGFGALLLIMLVVGGIGYESVMKMSDANARAIADLTKSKLAAQMNAATEKQSTGIRGFLLAGKEDLLKHDQEGQAEFKEASDQLQKLLSTEEGRRLFAEIQRAAEQFRAMADKEIALKRAGKGKEAEQVGFAEEATQIRNALRGALSELDQFYDKQSHAAVEEGTQIASRTRDLIIVCVVLGLIVGIVIAGLIVRSVRSTLLSMGELIGEIAGNNLAVADMKITSEDEIGKAGSGLNQMKNNLREMIQSIAGTAEHVASASEEISSSATQQAQGAETQKDQTSQVATAMQEMSSTVAQVSDNSNKAAEASRQAAETARHGGSIVEETLNKMRVIADSVRDTARKMEELGKSSDQIGRIIGVIDDIADQTNLLALNAAIEAARAGEQGRGFAVVADEVRKLAERTTTATKEIAQMIKNIQDETKSAVSAMEQGTKQVEEGVNSTAKAGDSLKEIIQMSEQVGEMITHIATAATEQSSATEQVNHNMDEIARLVKESATGAQQSARACQDLSGLALDLQKMVGNFVLGSETSNHATAKQFVGNAGPARELAKGAVAGR